MEYYAHYFWIKIFFLFFTLFHSLEAANDLKIVHRSEIERNFGRRAGNYQPNVVSSFGELIDQINGNFFIRHSPNREFEYFITFSSSSPDQNRVLRRGREKLRYQIYKGNGKDDYLSSQIGGDVENILMGSVSSNSTESLLPLSYYFYIFPDQFVGAGRYRDSITLRLYSGDPKGSYRLEDTKEVVYSVDVASEVYVSLLGSAGGVYTLDFGELQSFERQEIDIAIESNSRVRLKVSSENGGVLKNKSVQQFGDVAQSNLISYQFFLGGERLDLGKKYFNVALDDFTGIGSYQRLFPVSVIIGNVEGKEAGTYSDTVYMVVQNVY